MRFILLPLSSHSVAPHTHTQFGFPFELGIIPCKEYFVLRAATLTAAAAAAPAEPRAMDNHDALYVFILHVDSILQRENVICIFHDINCKNGGTSSQQKSRQASERTKCMNEQTQADYELFYENLPTKWILGENLLAIVVGCVSLTCIQNMYTLIHNISPLSLSPSLSSSGLLPLSFASPAQSHISLAHLLSY